MSEEQYNYSDQVFITVRDYDTEDATYWLSIKPVYQNWILSILINGYFPCDMQKLRKICKYIYDYTDFEEGLHCFTRLHGILSKIVMHLQDKEGASLYYIKRMKKNIDYIERMMQSYG